LAARIALACGVLFIAATLIMMIHQTWVGFMVTKFHGNLGFFNFLPLIFILTLVFIAPIWLCIGRSTIAAWIVLAFSMVISARLVFMAYVLLRWDLAHAAAWGRPLELLQSLVVPLAVIWVAEAALSWRAVKATSALRRLAPRGRAGIAAAFD
jgi:hypothetical protein